MKKLFKRKKTSDFSESDSDVAAQVGAIKRQLDILEEKIDSLMTQSDPPQPSRNQLPQRQFSHQGTGRRDYGHSDVRMTQATCSSCNNVCQVPFKPMGNRPVYCSDCFSKQKRDTPSHDNRSGKPKKAGFDRTNRFGKPKTGGFERFINKGKGHKRY